MFNGGADQVVINRIAEIVADKILPDVEKAVEDKIVEKMSIDETNYEFEQQPLEETI